ncbi:uncharacterized protein LOC121272188 [Carcharodon carcharias]|uniref:uncharacterized protein LOC121272188 n=1 Tax=Carcharodon carcharias TaxID=13397 RepID=UPI001B7D9FE2|nr:uncharacterized protein LOC121272188 [Carcharodon carcharias]
MTNCVDKQDCHSVEMIGETLFAVTFSLCIVGGTAYPVLIQSPSLERVAEGQTVQLQCNMQNAAVRNTKVDWYRRQSGRYMKWISSYHRNGYKRQDPYFTGHLQPSRDTSSNSFILTITNVQPSDAGVYYCTVWGSVYGEGTQLTVTSAPVLIQFPSLERVTEGHTAQLQCIMRNAAVRDTDAHWYRELPEKDMEWVLTHDIQNNTQRSPGFTERFQPFRDTSNNSFILTITNVQPSDTAVYYCKVWGDISGDGTRLNITSPLADPILLQYPIVSKVPEGETVELQCAMYNAGVNDTDVHWYRQGPGYNSEWVLSQFVNGTITKSQGFHSCFQLSRNVSSNSYILTIVNVTLNDTAVYNCSVWSYIYGAGTQLNVTDESSYNKPWTSDLIVLSTGTILGFVVLFCIALATFYLVRKRLCSAKNSTPGVSDEDQSPVYTTVNDITWTSDQTAVSPVLLGEGECNYAELQFHRRDTVQPTVIIAESTSEYADVKRTLN